MENQILYMVIALGGVLLLVLSSRNFRFVLQHCIFRPKCECKLVLRGKYIRELKG